MAKSLAVWVDKANDIPVNKSADNTFSNLESPVVDEKSKDNIKNTDASQSIELHFNYWILNDKELSRKQNPQNVNTWRGLFKVIFIVIHKLSIFLKLLASFAKERENITYLDVGVKFSNLEKNEAINIYFPFAISPENYDGQLGLNVANDVLLLSAIFNDEVKIIEFHDNLYHHSDIKFSPKGKEKSKGIRFFTNIDLQASEHNPLGAGVQLHQDTNGSILSFPIKNFEIDNPEYEGYFRFRLILDPLSKKSLSTYYVPSDSFMLTTEESMEIIDFRVNEIRNTPENVNSLLTLGGCLKKVHFFIIREVKSEYVMSDTKYSRSRLLEGNLWKQYLQSQYIKPIQNVPKMLIFHWKSPGDKLSNNGYLENFSAFAKFRHTRRSVWIILRSIAIGLIFSIAANWLYDLLKHWLC